jgi:hypothetical protein
LAARRRNLEGSVHASEGRTLCLTEYMLCVITCYALKIY